MALEAPEPLPLFTQDEEKKSLISMRPGFHFRPPPQPHELSEPITPDAQLFQTIHMGAALVDADLWTLTIEGMVERPFSISLESLKALAQSGHGKDVLAFHECYGSPLKPPTDFVRRVGCVRWTGISLRSLLNLAKPFPGASFIWSSGLDHGSFAGVEANCYQKDLPLVKAMQDEVLVAWLMNGRPLDLERGGPVRLVVPGWFGTNSVKWLSSVSLQAERAQGPFTTRFYNELVPGREAEGIKRPVWEVEISSVIVSPAPGDMVKSGPIGIWGWAWGCDTVQAVDVSFDDGNSWKEASVEGRKEWEWQRWSTEAKLPGGDWKVLARAEGKNGGVQPMTGRRNQVHRVNFSVVCTDNV